MVEAEMINKVTHSASDINLLLIDSLFPLLPGTEGARVTELRCEALQQGSVWPAFVRQAEVSTEESMAHEMKSLGGELSISSHRPDG